MDPVGHAVSIVDITSSSTLKSGNSDFSYCQETLNVYQLL